MKYNIHKTWHLSAFHIWTQYSENQIRTEQQEIVHVTHGGNTPYGLGKEWN